MTSIYSNSDLHDATPLLNQGQPNSDEVKCSVTIGDSLYRALHAVCRALNHQPNDHIRTFVRFCYPHYLVYIPDIDIQRQQAALPIAAAIHILCTISRHHPIAEAVLFLAQSAACACNEDSHKSKDKAQRQLRSLASATNVPLRADLQRGTT